MKFQRSTLILVGVAFLLGAGVLIAESQRSQSPPSATQSESTEPILAFEEADVATLTVDRGDETLVFEQGDDGNWQMTAPENALAEPGAVAFLLSRLNTDSPLQTVTMTADQATDFGFDAPVGIVTVTLKDGTEHELILGGPDFSGSANYAVVDPDPWPPAEGQEYSVLVVTRDVANGINRPLEEWLMPVETPNVEAGEDDAAIPNDSETPEDTPESEAPPESPAAPEATDNGAETTN
ncbi:DUF4340 domain-containing protein [Nodosilinea sp. LEGE 07298]|uniref:DUF4340 domain-containing protein n=1 Tax=Nodosilinea sp. LEGE 07298 TaxID=2777970 RepID=UPI0018830104|nr:DUF4340 domain-containing protein [Nodosilinea sp. LEGE 07298]MBE9113171.1 DUF4340 domain-containing protein [Nodosilinea sp. LEGE 07298]